MNITKREIVNKIQDFILAGGVVLAEKTKSITYGGKHLVSVGRYQEAIRNPNRRFAVLYTGKRLEAHAANYHNGSYWAAHEFVSFCGNQIAWDAYVSAKGRTL